MARVYMFNPLVSSRYGPSQSVIVNSDGAAPYNIKNTSAQIDYIPYSTSGARAPGNQPSGNTFVDTNTLLIKNDLLWNYAFDLIGMPGDLIAYIFREQIVLLSSNGNYLRSYDGDPAHGDRTGHAGRSTHRETKPARAEASAAGSVFVFNLFSQRITFLSNGGKAGDIPAWSDGTQSTIYTPSNIPVQRVLNSNEGPGKIFNGLNKITIVSESINLFSMEVDGSRFPLIQTLLLYVLRDRWYLFDEFGVLIEWGPIDAGASVNDDSLCNQSLSPK
ncbi:hypothetical protein ACVWZV_009226 [Bradyrhizobium sp. GM5.1]